MRIRSLLVAMSTATLVALAPTGATEAQSGTQVILAHGLNLNGQDSTQDRGSNVTVCRNGSVLLNDFQFGDIIGPALVPTGVEISLTVFSGADVDCEAPGGAELLIDTTFTPDQDPVALIATIVTGGAPGFAALPLDRSCLTGGDGRLNALHASADIGDVELLVDAEPIDTLTFGDVVAADLPAGRLLGGGRSGRPRHRRRRRPRTERAGRRHGEHRRRHTDRPDPVRVRPVGVHVAADDDHHTTTTTTTTEAPRPTVAAAAASAPLSLAG